MAINRRMLIMRIRYLQGESELCYGMARGSWRAENVAVWQQRGAYYSRQSRRLMAELMEIDAQVLTGR